MAGQEPAALITLPMGSRVRFNKRDIAALVERGFLPEGDCSEAEFDRAVIAMLEIIEAANLTA